MSQKVICVARGADGVENAFSRLDETQVQLLYAKFPVGTGTFMRNKFIYVIFIGPNCSVVKRGKGIAEINNFRNQLQGAAGITVTEKSSLSLPSLIQQMRKVFVTDTGNFSLEKIQEDYKRSIVEQGRKMHRDVVVRPVVPVSPQPVQEEEDEEEETELPSFTSLQLSNIVCEIQDNERRILDALHADLGPLNWATFEANPLRLTLADAGNGGIFELVKRLPETKWLFGLFRITLGRRQDRMTRLIFFQWIGNKLRLVRQGPTTRIFPKMASILAPYQYEIYLVGKQDLKPQAIIDKCRHAFEDKLMAPKPGENKSENLINAKAGLRHNPSNGNSGTTMFTEKEYNEILQEERSKMDLNFDFIRPKKKKKSCATDIVPKSSDQSVIYNTEETLKLINQSEGGLIWGIFQVQ
ncbi:uncharacterized protein TM35_000072440 [Trypanosoma theileri]|uniref:ADF-H domain-containing protein n=1 Tax=Trypanosoma theileri TaxID=67003 RepID=A0A1X0P342_9TRYP|nr:uncharacterized protein TM35_000072440 [Trypanosoma theileri]ORC90820.1 hypothetical protein TM35_000072440 [Trypanosoma theileri]